MSMDKKKFILLLLILILPFAIRSQVIRDASGIRTGEVEKSGTIRDRSGLRIGTAEGVDKRQAAVLFFFR
jgi:hypothetical protein